jgi:hypothetical protein
MTAGGSFGSTPDTPEAGNTLIAKIVFFGDFGRNVPKSGKSTRISTN